MRFFFWSFLEEDEKIFKIFRRPIFFILKSLLWRLMLWGGIVFLVWFFYPQYIYEKRLWFDLNYIWQILAMIGILHTLSPFFYWYVNALVMTNESLIFIEWPKFFHRKATRIDFHNLDEVAVERIGFKSFLLNYGNIFLAKINGGDAFTIQKIKAPYKTARIIETYRETYLDSKNFTEESALKHLLSGMVQRHVGENGQPERRLNQKQYEVLSAEISNHEKGEPEKIQKTFSQRAVEFHHLDNTQVEKELDDTGGIDIDLENK